MAPIFLPQTHYSGAFVSSDNGSSWYNAGHADYNDGPNFGALGISGSNLIVLSYGSVILSPDSGKNWMLSDLYLLPEPGQAGCMATLGTKLFVGTYNSFGPSSGVFVSGHNGIDTFTQVSAGLIDFDVYSLLSYGNNLFAGTNGQVFLTTNEGARWRGVSTGLPNVAISALAVSDSNLFAGTYNYGVWRRPLSEMMTSGVTSSHGLPVTLKLEQNYPNPFSQSTTIRFTAPDHGAAQVTIVNLLGEEVARLFSEEVNAGEHSFTWDAHGVTPGMYECVLKMNDRVQQMPMILVR